MMILESDLLFWPPYILTLFIHSYHYILFTVAQKNFIVTVSMPSL